MDAKPSGTVIISAFSRPELFEKCLFSVFDSYNIDKYGKILFIQGYNKKVLQTAKKYADDRTSIFFIDGTNRSPLQNINFNRYQQLYCAFEIQESKWVLALEEDIELHKNTFNFIEQIYANHENNSFFRGINLGSLENGLHLSNSYSCLRHGLNGQGSVVTRQSWNQIKKIASLKKLQNQPFDWVIEQYLKSGYMVTPNLSFIRDNGWQNGTHAPSNKDNPYYLDLSTSYSSNVSKTNTNFHRLDILHAWPDSPIYRYETPFKSKAKYILSTLLNNYKFLEIRKKFINYSKRGLSHLIQS